MTIVENMSSKAMRFEENVMKELAALDELEEEGELTSDEKIMVKEARTLMVGTLPMQYQTLTTYTAIYPDAGKGSEAAYAYLGLKLAGEAGEISENIGKMMRDDDETMGDERYHKVAKELGDVLWYLCRMASEMKLPFNFVVAANLVKLARRSAAGRLHGEGDNR